LKSSTDAGCFPTGKHYPGIAHLLRINAAGLAAEFGADTPLADLPLVSIDTETTGRDAASDRIVEIATVLWEHGVVVARKSWLVNPERPIPAEAMAVHKITDEMVSSQPRFAEIIEELLVVCKGHVPLAYNAEFDRNFILAEFARAGVSIASPPPTLRRDVEWVDPLVWARQIQKAEKSRSLGDVATRLGITINQAHRATDDAEAAVLVLCGLMTDPSVPKSYGAFMQEQRRFARIQQEERMRWRSNRGG
jgi:DNA polymerase III subunit epsilon